MSGGVKILPHYTYNDYVNWEGKWELIDGIPYAMSPAPLQKHQIVATNLSAEFRFALKKCGHCKVMQPVDYKLAEDNVFLPDMLVVCKPIEKKFLDFPPSLVVEVVSPSSVLIDRHKKFYAYQEQGILFYLIVSPETEETAVFVLEDGEYTLKQKGHGFTFSFAFEHECEATINLVEIWK